MKSKLVKKNKHNLRQYWIDRSEDPENVKMSRGAFFISRLIPTGRGEYWRKNQGRNPVKKKDTGRRGVTGLAGKKKKII